MDEKTDVSQKEESHQLIPEKEVKCVWMTAGLITYKLCKYGLQCERCPLDWELRNLSATPSFDPPAFEERKDTGSEQVAPVALRKKKEPGEKFLKEDLSLLTIRKNLFYHPGHTWIKVEKADEVRVGLDFFLGTLIGKVNVVLLPLSGRRALQGETLCSIVQEEGILHIVFPVSGLILSVNQKLKDQPELISTDPLEDGFLITLKPKNFQRDQKSLLSGEVSLSWYRKEWERFKETVVSELHHGHERLGVTMQDGGINLGDIERWIGSDRYIELISTFLRNGEKNVHQFNFKKNVKQSFKLG